jgi:hypothetical protein
VALPVFPDAGKSVKQPTMVTSRFRLVGLLAVLLALMAQLGAGASVPRIDPVAVAGVLCHTDNNGNAPAHGPNHPADCPLCPLCATVHAQAPALLSDAPVLTPPAVLTVLRVELPPPATAPPVLHRPPSQPRAPPTDS